MKIINCDKCGNRINEMFCNPELGENEEASPSTVNLKKGYDRTNCNTIPLRKGEGNLFGELCRTCYEKLWNIVTKFIS